MNPPKFPTTPQPKVSQNVTDFLMGSRSTDEPDGFKATSSYNAVGGIYLINEKDLVSPGGFSFGPLAWAATEMSDDYRSWKLRVTLSEESRASFGSLRFIFEAEKDFPDLMPFRSMIFVMTEKFTTFNELLPNVPFELANRWLHCTLRGQLIESCDVVGKFNRLVSVNDWWMDRHLSVLTDYRSVYPGPYASMLILNNDHVWKLTQTYADAFSLSAKSGSPIETCWDIITERVSL